MVSRNRYSMIGLDLGETSAKMVQLRADGKAGWQLHAAVRAEYYRAGSDEEGEQALASTVKRMLAKGHFAGRKAATVLHRPDVLIRPIKLSATLDGRDKEAVWSAVQSEARRYLPYPPEEAVLDFLTVGKVRDDDEEKLEVLLICAPEKKVSEHIALLESAGLGCVCIDVAPCSVLRTVERIHGDKGQDGIVIVEIAERATVVAISRSGQLLFSRSVKTGGGTLTDEIAGRLGLAHEKAEMFKREYGIDHRKIPSGEFTDGTTISPDDMPAVLYELCHEELGNLAREIKRSAEYFVAQFRGVAVEKALLFGGGANLKGLPDFLHERTGLTVEIGDPFVSVRTDNGDSAKQLGADKSSFAVALGLALREG